MHSGDGPAAEMRAFFCIGNTVIGMEQPHFRRFLYLIKVKAQTEPL
jgi:hypothetical protein